MSVCFVQKENSSIMFQSIKQNAAQKSTSNIEYLVKFIISLEKEKTYISRPLL